MSCVRKYNNPWIPVEAVHVLDSEEGSILDVGGGAAPFWKASHVIDIMPFDAARLRGNAWGKAENKKQKAEIENETRIGTADQGVGSGQLRVDSVNSQPSPVANEEPCTKNQERVWEPNAYTQWDLCSGARWPFADKSFDLGLSSHCLEDIRDPVQVVREMARVCKRTLIICPSRLLEQMRGVDHPRYCGMPHHLWLVFEENGELFFRRKTPLMEFPGMHLVCPLGKRLTTEAGSMFYLSENPVARELMFFDMAEDKREYAAFVKQKLGKQKVEMEWDGRWLGWRRWVWYFRQKWLWEG